MNGIPMTMRRRHHDDVPTRASGSIHDHGHETPLLIAELPLLIKCDYLNTFHSLSNDTPDLKKFILVVRQ